MFFLKPSVLWFLAVVLLMASSCQSPSLTTQGPKAQVSLELTWPTPASSSASSSGARLLLPNSAWVSVTAVDGTTDTQTVSQSISPTNGSASVNLSLLVGETYKISVMTYTAQGGKLTGSAATSFTVVAGSTPAPLNLLPPATISLNSWQPWVDTNFPANGSQTLSFDLSDSTALVLGVPSSGGTGPTLYYQNLDGSSLVPTLTSTGVQTIPVTSLTPGSSGFLMTVYNPTSAAITPGRGYFNFTLDPTKIGVAVYVLDSGTPGIDVYTLDEVKGALSSSPLQIVSIPSTNTPVSFVLDPGQKRLYVAEATVNGYALDAYTIGPTGSLTEIGSPVTAPVGTQAFAISTEQILYWITSIGVDSEALASNGAPVFSSPTPVLSGSFSKLTFDAGSDGLWAVGPMTVAFVSPQTPSAGLTTTLTTAVDVWQLQTDPFSHELFTVQNQISLQPYASTASTLSSLGSPVTLPNTSTVGNFVLAFALDPQGQNFYYCAGTAVGSNVYSATISSSGTLAYGNTSFQDPSGVVNHLAVDPTGRWLIASDNKNLYSLATPNVSNTGNTTPVNLATTVADLAVLRYQ
jgi:hypothetical protein